MRQWINLVETIMLGEASEVKEANPLRPLVDEASALMRRTSLATDGIYTIKRRMTQKGYLKSPDNVDDRTKEFEQAFVAWSKAEVQEMWLKLHGLIHNGYMKVWREIIVPEDWKPNPNEHLGLFWSWDIEGAEAHWRSGSEGIPWLLTATVAEDDIDWVRTLVQNTTLAYEDEKEIKVEPSSKIHLDSWEPRK